MAPGKKRNENLLPPQTPTQAREIQDLRRKVFETPIDLMFSSLRDKEKITFNEASKKFGLTVDSVEKIGLALEKRGIVDVHYPKLITRSPSIELKIRLAPQQPEGIIGEVMDEYSFGVDSVQVRAKIVKARNHERPVYFLDAPMMGPYTKAFLEEIKDSIMNKVPVEVSELTDQKKTVELKEKFFSVAKSELAQHLEGYSKEGIGTIAGLLLHSMYGLGKLELLMGDNMLEEITVNSSFAPVIVYHRKHGWIKSTLRMDSEEETYNYASQIARKVGRDITTLNPILDAHLLSGDRVNATLNPISTFGNTITIRRFARRPWTVIDFIGESHTMNLEMASLLWLGMQYEMNILIAGGTASGKTSVLNVLSAFIPNYHRVISIEDVREITLPDYLKDNWVPLRTRNPNQEGQGEVAMLDLMHSSLRMRPDRIILGEIRRHREAEVLFEAMHTGHSVYSTIHANNAQQVLRRLTEEPINIPPLEVEAIDLVLVQHRDRRTNSRRAYEIAELEAGVSDKQLSVNTVFKWSPREDSWENVNPASKLVRNLNLHTGMTQDDIAKELEQRATILQWMLDNDFGEINQVGMVMNAFYSNPERMRKAAEKNADPKEALGE